MSQATKITHASLFSGIGVFDLAAQEQGIENVFNCENDSFCSELGKKNFPNVPNLGDITKANFKPYANTINILTGGFPCQNISIAGMGEGILGSRSSLWTHFARAIQEINPTLILIENSSQLVNKGLEAILYQVSTLGYNAEWECIRASDIGKPHERDRLFILCYPSKNRWGGLLHSYKNYRLEAQKEKFALDLQRNPYDRFAESHSQPPVFGVVNGLAKKLDAVNRLGACGNAIVYDIAYDLIKICKELLIHDHDTSNKR